MHLLKCDQLLSVEGEKIILYVYFHIKFNENDVQTAHTISL